MSPQARLWREACDEGKDASGEANALIQDSRPDPERRERRRRGSPYRTRAPRAASLVRAVRLA
jgi:hypothetical protein